MNISGLTRIVSNVLNRCSNSITNSRAPFHSLNAATAVDHRPGGLFGMVTRSVIRVHFPRPSERKRIKVHGWNTRMKTAPGRRILMNRILKGRFVYSH